jgi:hypothetical protein
MRSPVVSYKVFWQTYAWTRFVQRSHLAPDESSKIYFILIPNSLRYLTKHLVYLAHMYSFIPDTKQTNTIYFPYSASTHSENKLVCMPLFTDLSESAAPFCVAVLGQGPQLHVMYTAKANSFISQT